jgi:hypothetical protein
LSFPASGTARPPAAGISQMSTAGSDSGGTGGVGFHPSGRGRVERNATHLPSGEYTGARASGSSTSAGTGFSPAAGTRQRDSRSAFVAGSTHWRTYTADLPSGLTATSRGASDRYKSSTVSSRFGPAAAALTHAVTNASARRR